MKPTTAPLVSATIHIYRALMDRTTVWRQRIDTSTNWAITTASASSSFVLSDPTHSHAILLLITLLVAMFLVVEARRMRFYDLWAGWVRLLETDYLVGIIRDGQVGQHQPWEHMFVHDLEDPHFKASFRDTLARRLRDNYVALFSFLLLIWLLKLTIHESADQSLVAPSVIERAAIGPLPGVAVFAGVMLVYLAMLLFTGLAQRPGQPIEVATRAALLARLAAPDQPLSRRQSEQAVLAQFHSDFDDIPLKPQDWD